MPNVFTVIADVSAAFLLVAHGPEPVGRWLCVVAAGIALYWAGMILNDVFDVDPTTSIFFEDTPRNLEVPKQMGMTTVLVGEEPDWGRTPTVNRPSGTARKADWIDAVTDDLAGWLVEHAPQL